MKKSAKKTKVIIIAACMIAACLIAFIAAIKLFYNNGFRFKYDKLDKVLAEQEDILGSKYDNLILPDKIAAVYPEKLYEYYSSKNLTDTSDEAFDKAYSLINSFTGGAVEKSDIYIDDQNYFRFDPDQEKGKNFTGFVAGDGSCDITTLEAMYTRVNATGIADTVYIRYGESADVSFDIYGEQYSVAQAVAFCDKYLKEINYMQYFEDNIEIKPSYVQVVRTKGPNDFDENPDGPVLDTFYYNVCYDIYMDGVPLNDAGATNIEGQYFSDTYFNIQIDKKDHVGQIRRYSQIAPERRTELKCKFVTLKSALDNISKYLSKDYKYEVKEVGIRYCSLENLGAVDKIARPYWRVVLIANNGYAMFPFMARCAYVDMETGDMYVYDDYTRQMIEPA